MRCIFKITYFFVILSSNFNEIIYNLLKDDVLTIKMILQNALIFFKP